MRPYTPGSRYSSGISNYVCVCVDDRRWLQTLKAARVLLIRFGFVIASSSCRIYIAARTSHKVFVKFNVTMCYRNSETLALYIINKKCFHSPFPECIIYIEREREKMRDEISPFSLTLGFAGKKK